MNASAAITRGSDSGKTQVGRGHTTPYVGDGSAEPRRDVFVGGEPRGDTRGEDIAVVAGIMLPLRY